jgi:hypothetical protein
MALTWALPMALIAFLTLTVAIGSRVATLAAGAIVLGVGAVFAGLPWLPVTGGRRWLTYGGLALVTFAAGGEGLLALGGARPAALAGVAATCTLAAGILSLDLTGTTPWGDAQHPGIDVDADDAGPSRGAGQGHAAGAASHVQHAPTRSGDALGDPLVDRGDRASGEATDPAVVPLRR